VKWSDQVDIEILYVQYSLEQGLNDKWRFTYWYIVRTWVLCTWLIMHPRLMILLLPLAAKTAVNVLVGDHHRWMLLT